MTYLAMVFVYLCSIILSSVIGFINGASIASVFNDVKPLLFFIYILPFSFLIKDETDIQRVIKTLKVAALILSVVYFIYILVYFWNPLVILVLAPFQSNGEVFIRGNGPFLFYKGFFFIMIGIFLIQKERRIDRIILFVLSTAIFLALTRGLIFAIIGSFLVMGVLQLFFEKRISIKQLILIGIIFILLLFLLPTFIAVVGDKRDSDAVRFALIENVHDAITPLSLIFGHGFGVFAGVNRDHLEISYYEILHKQGIIGLVIWAVPLLYCFILLVQNRSSTLIKRFFAGVLSVYIISLTNPFVNNPLGISIIVISIISMDVINRLYQEKKEIILTP